MVKVLPLRWVENSVSCFHSRLALYAEAPLCPFLLERDRSARQVCVCVGASTGRGQSRRAQREGSPRSVHFVVKLGGAPGPDKVVEGELIYWSGRGGCIFLN